MSKEKTGLIIDLCEHTPALIQFGGREIRVYLKELKGGKLRVRFVADDDVKIYTPNRVKKGWVQSLEGAE